MFASAPTGFQASGYSFHSHEWRNAKPVRGSLSPVNSSQQRNNILPDFGLGVDEWDRPSASGYINILLPNYTQQFKYTFQYI